MAKSMPRPVFKNISEIRATPRNPLILFFTGEQWRRYQGGLRRAKRGRAPAGTSVARFMPAPWGGGDVILMSGCRPRRGQVCMPGLSVSPESRNSVLIRFRCFCVPEPRPAVGECELVIRGFVGGLPPAGVSPWECDNITCTGRCRLARSGTAAEGEVFCACRASFGRRLRP